MAEILPFRGYRYNQERVKDLAKVLAPPYDVISHKFQEELYERHPYNIVRLILGKTYPYDEADNNRYTRACIDFKKWQKDHVLEQERNPAVYYYTQTYKLKNGGTKNRKGFIALARLEEFGSGKIHPHEKTLAGPKTDRLNLIKACKANFCCIFSLYSEPEKTINSILEANADKTPLAEIRDDDDVINRLWKIDEPEIIKDIAGRMQDKPLFIADGHHRYETALNYQRFVMEGRKRLTGKEPFNYVMMYFSNMDDEGMTILPTHRIVHSIPGFIPKAFLVNCSNFFDIHEVRFDNATEPEIKKAFYKRFEEMDKSPLPSFGLAIKGTDSYFILQLRGKDIMEQIFKDTIPQVFKSLDVTVLHSLIFAKILGLSSKSQEEQQNIIYVKGADETLESLRNENNQMAFLLHPTKIEQVKEAAKAGYVMPQKSTYFYPKLISGLVINSVDENEGTEDQR